MTVLIIVAILVIAGFLYYTNTADVEEMMEGDGEAMEGDGDAMMEEGGEAMEGEGEVMEEDTDPAAQ